MVLRNIVLVPGKKKRETLVNYIVICYCWSEITWETYSGI